MPAVKADLLDQLDQTVTDAYVQLQATAAARRTPGVQGKRDVKRAVEDQLLGRVIRVKASHSTATVDGDLYVQ